MPRGHGCIEHTVEPHERRADGRCPGCRKRANAKFAAKQRADLRKYKQIKQLLSA